MENGNTPVNPILEDAYYSLGLTKREYFAGLILQGLCANPEFYKTVSAIASPENICQFYNESAIEQADEFLKQLEK